MEKDFNSSIDCNSSNLRESDNEQSFVGKFKSIINSTPLSKWFRKQDDSRSTVRRRDDEDEDIICQPPSKKVKLPGDYRENNCELSFEVPVRPLLKNDKALATASSSSTVKTSLNCFPPPSAGPSGVRHRKTLASATVTNVNQNLFNASEVFNGHNKDNTDSEGESTSGYSSVPRINSKEHVYLSQDSSKQTSPTQNNATPNNTRSLFPNSNSTMNRSLFSDKISSPTMNTSMSSRRPSFNASTFGSPNFMDKTLATKKIINSPFYSGRTVYGGASAYGRKLGRSAQDLQSNLKTSVRIKPVNQQSTTESGDLVLGKTARRILETLEQYSSPVNDAKKIPISSKRPHREGAFSKYIGANPYCVKDSKVLSNRELQVPNVSDLLKMKQKTRLQDSTENVRQIAKSSKSDLNTETYKLSTSESGKEKHTGKMRNKIASVRQQKAQHESEVLNDVNLANVSLPITTLPKFDLVIPPPVSATSMSKPKEKITSSSSPTSGSSLISSSSTISINTSSVNSSSPTAKETQKTVQQMIGKQQSLSTSSPSAVEYKFSKPIVISENLKSIVACNNFKFSEPISKESMHKHTSSVPAPTMVSSTLNFKMPENKLPTLVPTTNNKNKKNNGETTTIAKPASTLITTGSVMDILGKKNTVVSNDSFMDKFKPSTGSWECNSCMLRNDADKTACVACEAPKKQQPSEQNNSDFGNKFKVTTDKWECSCCLVRNDSKDTKCIACTTPKSSSADKKDTSTISTVGFGNQFKTTSDMWECPTCMIKNKNSLDKCAACETVRPSSKDSKSSNTTNTSITSGGFGGIQVKKNGDWECPDCMVRNDSSKIKCQCCEAAKPGTNNKAESKEDSQKPTLKFAFDIDKSTAQAFTFGIPPAAAAASSSLPKPTVNPASVFGEQSKASSSAPATFTFGIPKNVETAKSAESTSKPVKIQMKTPEPPQPATFKFGTPLSKPSAVNTPKENETTKTSVANSDSEAAPQKPTFIFSSPKTTASSNAATSSPSTSFKMPVATSTTVQQPTSMFSFGAKPTATAKPLTSTNPSVTEVNKQLPQTSSSSTLFGSRKPLETSAKRPLETSFEKPLEIPAKTSIATPASTNIFGGDNMKSTAIFSFGNKNAPSAASPSSLFGSNNTAKAVDPPKADSSSNNFTNNLFGATKSTDNNFIFGAGTANLATDKPAAPAFGGPLIKQSSEMTVSMFGGNTKMENVTPIFAATTTSKAMSNVAPPVFGTAAATGKPAPEVPPTTTSSIFGAVKPSAAAATTTTPLFGGAKSSDSAAGQTTFGGSAPVNNGFGNANGGFGSSNFGSQTTTTNEVKPFTFMGDASSGEPASKAPMFSFGQSASSNNAVQNNPVSGFNLGGFSAPTAAPGSSGGFNFSNNATKTGDVTSSFTNSQSSSSAAKNGIFNFGSAAANNNSQKVGFSFGATPNTSTTSGGFNFGASTAAPAPSTVGFNFSAAPPKFDANIKPTFNFTDGAVTTFSAQPSSDGGMAMPARKIKKAFRRTHR